MAAKRGKKRKLIFVVLDGLGDRPIQELDNKTPLEYAHTPNLDSLAARGRTGLVTVISKSIAPESDQGMFALLGYDPFRLYTGRGVLEAYGYGVPFKKGEVVVRVNFATADKGLITDIQAGKPSDEEAIKLAKSLAAIKEVNGIKTRFVRTIGYRAVLILSGRGLSANVSNTHPGYKIVKGKVSTALPVKGKVLKKLKCEALDRNAASKKAAAALNAFVEKAEVVLAKDPVNRDRAAKGLPQANTLLLRSASSSLPKLKRLKGKWLLLADMPVESAIGKLAGMNVMKTPESLFQASVLIADNINRYNNFYVHIKETDSHSHRGDFSEKKCAVERIDEEFFGYLITHITTDNVIIAVTADHATPCALRAHSEEPVPLLVFGNGITPDSAERFNERECRKGSLGTIQGVKLLKKIQSLRRK